MKPRSAQHIPPVLVLLALLLLLSGCMGKKTVTYIPLEERGRPTKQQILRGEIARDLKRHYVNWQGTRYRHGGISRKGVDCSGFTQVTYKKLFGLALPRTVREQVKHGKKVSRASLQTGDLVFFKTGLFQKHVGIYLERKNFIHASPSKGVTISSLDNVYWQKHYWQAKRL